MNRQANSTIIVSTTKPLFHGLTYIYIYRKENIFLVNTHAAPVISLTFAYLYVFIFFSVNLRLSHAVCNGMHYTINVIK